MMIDNPLRFRIAYVVEEPVLASDRVCRRLPSRPTTMAGTGVVEGVDRLASLEEGIRVLRSTANDRPVRGQRAIAVGANLVVVDHVFQVVVLEVLDLRNLM